MADAAWWLARFLNRERRGEPGLPGRLLPAAGNLPVGWFVISIGKAIIPNCFVPTCFSKTP
jgi:hypothetical protein